MPERHAASPISLEARCSQRLTALLGADASGLHITVGYSGGLDSTVLLHLLARLAPSFGFRLSAIHVHHGLSSNADAWAAHCSRVCEALGIGLHVARVSVHSAGAGLEAAARLARYRAFADLPSDWLALAHHRGDQAETLLHRLLRGAGVRGAAAMREIDSRRHVIRPLLSESRFALAQYARQEGLQCIEDESNADTRYTRNYLRHEILQSLEQRFPAAEASLAKAARRFGEADGLLQELAAIDSAAVGLALPGSRGRFCALSEARSRNLLRYWFAGRGEQAADEARLNDCDKQIRSDAAIRWSGGQSALCAYRDRLWLEAATPHQPLARSWLGEAALPWGNGEIRFFRAEGSAALAIEPGEVDISLRRGGERLRMHPQGPSRALKQLCQEAGIPPWLRLELPVLRCGENVVWVGLLGSHVDFVCNADEQGWGVAWVPARDEGGG